MYTQSAQGDNLQQGDSLETFGVVVKIDEKDGMAYVRMGEQIGATAVPDDMLSKYSCETSVANPQVRGLGEWPPHNLVCGSLVKMKRNDQRGGYSIAGAIGASQVADQATKDTPAEADSSSIMTIINALSGQNGASYAFKQLFGNKNPSEFKSTMDALKFINQQFKTPQSAFKKDPIQEFVKNVVRPKKFGGKGIKEIIEKNTPSSMGVLSYLKGDVKSSTKAIKKVLGSKGEMIQKSIKMIEEAKKAVKSGNPTSALNAVGGASVLAQAIASAMALFQKATQGKSDKDKENDLKDLEALLMALYEQITGQKALDSEGKPTPHYLEWRELYLQGFEDIEEETNVTT